MQHSKLDFFAEICSFPSSKKIEFYSKDDTTLGTYILLKVTNMENKCNVCKHPRHIHVSIYYGAGTYIKITIESKFFLSENQARSQEDPQS